MELRQLRYFVAAATELNFSKASKKLHISQPAISRSVRDLEFELGADLFRRHQFGLVLTRIGQSFLLHAEQILRECEEALSSIKETQAIHLKLDIGFIPTALGSVLGDKLKLFRDKNPGIAVDLNELSPGDQIASLRLGQIDLAFIGNPCSSYVKEFMMSTIEEINLEAALPKSHDLANCSSINLREINQEYFIGYDEDKFPCRNETVTRACRKAGFKPNFKFKARSLSEVLGMIGAGFGVCLMPGDVKNLPHPNVAFIPIENADIEPIRLVAAWLPQNKNDALRYMLEEL